MFLLSTAVDCGSLPNPANGSISHTAGTTFGLTATYNCNTGYNLTGNSTRMCQATRMWSGSAPTCPRMFWSKSSNYQVNLHDVYSLQQLWTVALWVTQPMAVLVQLEQHLDSQPPTVVIQVTTWQETVFAHVKLQECGLRVHLPVHVCFDQIVATIG